MMTAVAVTSAIVLAVVTFRLKSSLRAHEYMPKYPYSR
jgi:hypothetical protein